MSMNLFAGFYDDENRCVCKVELLQTPTPVTYWCLGVYDTLEDAESKDISLWKEKCSSKETEKRYLKWIEDNAIKYGWDKEDVYENPETGEITVYPATNTVKEAKDRLDEYKEYWGKDYRFEWGYI